MDLDTYGLFGVQPQAFRMQQESQAGLSFLCTDGNTEDSPWDLATIRASHAETVLELQKTRRLLLLEHHISQDLQAWKHTETPYQSEHTLVVKRTTRQFYCS